jgi:hypothetical protein
LLLRGSPSIERVITIVTAASELKPPFSPASTYNALASYK